MSPRNVPVLVFLAFLLLIFPASAHVPLHPEGNFDLNHALVIENPLKSYVVYDHLHEAGDVAYYQLLMKPGDRLRLTVNTPGFDAPVPDMIIMGPGLAWNMSDIPTQVQIFPGYGAELVKGKQPTYAGYEPFTPSAIFLVASYDNPDTAEGAYYVAITTAANETDYSLAVGYLEEFTPLEWVLVPFNIIGTVLPWEGQSWIEIFAPFIVVLIIGFALSARNVLQKKIRGSVSFWLAIAAGLVYLGGAAITTTQMVRVMLVTGPTPLAVVTIIFIAIPVLLGIWALRIAFRAPFAFRDRISLLIIGILGFIIWAGIIIGPVIAILAAVLPDHDVKSDPAKHAGKTIDKTFLIK